MAKNSCGVGMRDALEEAAKQGEDAPGDIYNAGVAVSEETLLAWQETVGDQRFFCRFELAPETLHPDIHQRYFFPPERVMSRAPGFADSELVAILLGSGIAGLSAWRRRRLASASVSR